METLDDRLDNLGRQAYSAYRTELAVKRSWLDLTPRERTAWQQAAVAAVRAGRKVRVR